MTILKPKVIQIFKVLGAVIGGALLLITVVLYSIMRSACENDVLSEVVSPDQRYKAVTFRRDCGSTTAFSTHVSIMKASAMLGKASGNVFISDTNHGAVSDQKGGGPKINVSWNRPRILLIGYQSKARIFKQAYEHRSITIQYTNENGDGFN